MQNSFLTFDCFEVPSTLRQAEFLVPVGRCEAAAGIPRPIAGTVGKIAQALTECAVVLSKDLYA